jgi:hypothetical protein
VVWPILSRPPNDLAVQRRTAEGAERPSWWTAATPSLDGAPLGVADPRASGRAAACGCLSWISLTSNLPGRGSSLLGVNFDAPASELRGESYVLAVSANRQRQCSG